MKNITLILILALLIVSCDNKKEAQLNTREHELNLREQQLKAIEEEYEALRKMRDSLILAKGLAADTLQVVKWPDSLQQVWNSKMICRESNCNNYVIGDQRNEVWKFLSDSSGLYMNVVNNDKLVRVFRASYSENKIVLDYTADSTSTTKQKISVLLDDIQKKVIKGTQTITGFNDCTAKFSVELTPSTKQ